MKFFDTLDAMLALKSVELTGFKSFGKKAFFQFGSSIAAIVGPNGSGKSNVAEGFRFVLGEQSMKSMRSKRGEDLIWGGSPALPRQNRAGVKVVFDNSKRLLDIDFKEVAIERVVHRDGQNEYLLNGSQVRLKDIIRLLAGANIGGSGYQIISQGEADRILNASPRERREMVEDALGLKLYQHKKIESERQLDEAGKNLDKAKSLRRELAPHLNFLRVQVERIEKAREMKDDLAARLTEYLSRENAYITQEIARVKDEESSFRHELQTIERAISDAKKRVESAPKREAPDTRSLEAARVRARQAREDAMRELIRAEAQMEVQTGTAEATIPAARVRKFVETLESLITLSSFEEAKREIAAFKAQLPQGAQKTDASAHISELTSALEAATKEEERVEKDLEAARAAGVVEREAHHEAERVMLTEEANRRDMIGKLAVAERRLAELKASRQQFEEEVREGIVLVGSGATKWEGEQIPQGALSEPRIEQEKRRRGIERLKIKIEESGAGNQEEVTKEYRQTRERDEFLAREVGDLEISIDKLKTIIVELEETMDTKFEEGLKHINTALSHFFAQLFGGGEAKLAIEKPRRSRTQSILDEETGEIEEIEDESEIYAGLSISVQLPRKKVRGLEVLSGGERALTSIALIFSMSQVNPPPFLILDETDAALDEANSKRYADMIQELGKKSQLIVITHNRATMSAAGELYGVTMDSSGVSKVLSVKLEEAERVAK